MQVIRSRDNLNLNKFVIFFASLVVPAASKLSARDWTSVGMFVTAALSATDFLWVSLQQLSFRVFNRKLSQLALRPPSLSLLWSPSRAAVKAFLVWLLIFPSVPQVDRPPDEYCCDLAALKSLRIATNLQTGALFQLFSKISLLAILLLETTWISYHFWSHSLS